MTNLAGVEIPRSATQGDRLSEEEPPVDRCMQVASSPICTVEMINACMRTDPLYLTYVKDYRDIEQE